MNHRRYEDSLRINPLIYQYAGKHNTQDTTPEHDGYRFGHHIVTPRTNTYQDAENNDPNTRK